MTDTNTGPTTLESNHPISTSLPDSNNIARTSDGPPMRTFLDEVKSFFLGDDIFISYARADSTGYALALANRLGRKEFICYLDQYGTGINDKLDERVIGKLKRSRVLVLIGSRLAINSGAIRQEVELFKKTQRAIIPIDVDGAFRDTELYRVIRGLPLAGDPHPTAPFHPPATGTAEIAECLPETEINLRNDNPSSEVVDQIDSIVHALSKPTPSPRVVDRIKSTLSYTKRTQLQRRMLWLGSTFLLVSVSLAVVFLYVANEARAARDTAVKAAEDARGETDRANEQAAVARDKEIMAGLSQIAADMNQAVADLKRKDAEKREEQALLNAQRQERVARSLAHVTEAAQLETERPSDALVLSAAAYRSAPEAVATRTGLLRSLQRYRKLKSIVPSQSMALTSISSALNGRVIATVKNTYDNGRTWNVTLNLYDTKRNRRSAVKETSSPFALGRLVCTPTGNWCAASTVANSETKILVWRLTVHDDESIKGERLVQQFEFSSLGRENSFALTADEHLLAYQFEQRKVLVWDLTKPNDAPREIDLTGSGYTVECLAVSPDNRTMALGLASGVEFVDLINPSNPRTFVSFPDGAIEGDDAPKNLTFTPDGRFLAAGNTDNTAVVIEVSKHKILGETLRDSGSEVSFLPRKFETLLVTGNDQGRITTWRIRASSGVFRIEQEQSHDYRPGIFSLTALPNQNSTLVIGGGDGALSFWDMSAEPLLDSINDAQTRDNDHLMFDMSGRILLIDSRDSYKTFFEFSPPDLIEIQNPSAHKGAKATRFSPWVYAESERGVFLVDPMKPGAKPEEIPIEGEGVEAAAITADGHMLAVVKKERDRTGTKDTVHGVVLLDFRNKEKPRRLRTLEYREDAKCAAFSRDKRMVAVGYDSGRVILWDVSSGKILPELSSLLTTKPTDIKSKTSVISVAVSPDGRTVAASSFLSPLTLWDSRSGALIGALEPDLFQTDQPYSMVFSPTGKKLITSTSGGFKMWDIDPASWAKRAMKIANR